MTFLSSSYKTSTKAPPMPLSTLDNAPLKKALEPSSRKIFFQQSMVPVYMMSAVGKNIILKRGHTFIQVTQKQKQKVTL